MKQTLVVARGFSTTGHSIKILAVYQKDKRLIGVLQDRDSGFHRDAMSYQYAYATVNPTVDIPEQNITWRTVKLNYHKLGILGREKSREEKKEIVANEVKRLMNDISDIKDLEPLPIKSGTGSVSSFHRGVKKEFRIMEDVPNSGYVKSMLEEQTVLLSRELLESMLNNLRPRP